MDEFGEKHRKDNVSGRTALQCVGVCDIGGNFPQMDTENYSGFD